MTKNEKLWLSATVLAVLLTCAYLIKIHFDYGKAISVNLVYYGLLMPFLLSRTFIGLINPQKSKNPPSSKASSPILNVIIILISTVSIYFVFRTPNLSLFISCVIFIIIALFSVISYLILKFNKKTFPHNIKALSLVIIAVYGIISVTYFGVIAIFNPLTVSEAQIIISENSENTAYEFEGRLSATNEPEDLTLGSYLFAPQNNAELIAYEISILTGKVHEIN